MSNHKEPLRAQLNTLYAFAELHRWVAQLHERIETLLAGSPAEEARAMISEEYTDSSRTKESLVLSLVLLSRLGEGVHDTAKRLFATLRNRIDGSDQRFLTYHLFNDTDPLTFQDLYDITSRQYLSFRHAIHRGMKVGSMSSFFDPQRTLLYLTMIMCRIDLNEQNRAMLSFLISRIDTDLPENVLHGVFSYLRSLKHVIADLAEKGDTALTERLDYANEPVMPSQSASLDKAAHGSREEDRFGPEPTAEETIRDYAPVEAEYAIRQIGDRAAERQPRTTDGQGAARYQRAVSRRGDEAATAGGSATVGPFESPSISLRAAHTKGATDLPPAGERLPSIEKALSNADGTVEQEQSTGLGRGDGDNYCAATPGRYRILFNRNTEELLRIIEEIPGTVPEKASIPREHRGVETSMNAEASPNAGTSISATAFTPAALRSRALRFGARITATTCALALVFVLIVVILAPDKRPPSDTMGESAVTPSPTANRTTNPAPETVVDANTPSAGIGGGVARLSPTGAASPVGYHIDAPGSAPVWTVLKDNSLWGLYSLAKEEQLTYTIPNEPRWLDFVLQVFEANPDLQQLRLIRPGQRINLPVY